MSHVYILTFERTFLRGGWVTSTSKILAVYADPKEARAEAKKKNKASNLPGRPYSVLKRKFVPETDAGWVTL